MGTDDGTEGFGDGEGDEEMMTGELVFDLFFQPLSCFVMLAGGAVAVATAFVEDMRFLAAVTVIDRDAGGWGVALDDGLHGFAMLKRDSVSETLEIL